jgi:hypothetical protein
MRSVADALRLDSSRALATLPVAERISLALRLGDEDIARYQMAHRVSEADARRVFNRARAVGRLPSRSNNPDTL